MQQPTNSEEVMHQQNKSARLRSSCELCRKWKARCLPDKDDPSRCQRCSKDGKSCVFLEYKPRIKRAVNSRIRVAQMEEKINGIMELLSSKQNPEEDSTFLYATKQPSKETSEFNTARSQFPPPPQILNSFQQPSMYSFQFPLIFDGMNDLISKGFLTVEQAEESINIFKSKAHQFPFVILSLGTSLDSLRREKPFLLLAIITSCFHPSRGIKKKLEQEFKEDFSRRFFHNGEKSLELLQGLLIYIGWYHKYFDPETQQIYQLLQIACTMAVDLNITRPSHPPVPKLLDSDAEAKRSLVGCYYLSSSMCFALRKPNTIKCTDYMYQCSQLLKEMKEVETDALLPYFVSIQRLVDEINTSFDYDNANELPDLDAIRIQILLKTFEQKFNYLQTTMPDGVWQNAGITTAFLAIPIHIYEISLRAHPPDSFPLHSGTVNHLRYDSPVRSEALICCMEATKGFLDYYLSLSTEELENLILPDFTRVVYVLLVLGRFAVGCDASLMDGVALQLQGSSNIGYYIDSLIKKAQDVTATEDSNGLMCKDEMLYFQMFFEQCRWWYNGHMAGEIGSNFASFNPYADDMSTFDVSSAITNLCEAPLTGSSAELKQKLLCNVDFVTDDSTCLDPRDLMIGPSL